MTMLFTVALFAEARPLIEYFGLKKNIQSEALSIFRNDEIALILSGVGKVKSALATSYLIGQEMISEDLWAINIGIAGADEHLAAIGDIFLINKIVDWSTSREFFPDILIETGLKEITVTTFDRPMTQTSSAIPRHSLCEMEASGFFEAAATFLPPHRIACLKIVSDYLELRQLTKKHIENLVLNQMSAIANFVDAASASGTGEVDEPLKGDDKEWIQVVARSLCLTSSQKRLLTDWVLRYLYRHGKPLPNARTYTSTVVATKDEGKRRFKEIRRLLLPE